MNVLLTGGAGYIGSHTAFLLHQAGFTPVVLDNLCHGHEKAVKYGPLVKGNMGDADCVAALCKTYQPVAAIHFAALIEVGESVREPARYLDNNFHKAARLFDTLEQNGVDKIVFSSTAAVYGTPRDDSAIEETHPLAPINPYGESKYRAEENLRARAAMKSAILRYFNAAGALPSEGLGEAHEPETHLIPNIILAGLGQKPALQIFGHDYPTPDGTAIRDYVHVMDLASAHLSALRHLLDGGENIVCNLGTGTGYSVKQVVEMVERKLSHTVPKQFQPKRDGDAARLVADNRLAQKLLGWQSAHDLEAIVESALAWHLSSTRSLLR